MVDEKKPILPVTGDLPAKPAAEDGRPARPARLAKGKSANGNIWVQLVMPVVMTLLILGVVMMLPLLVRLTDVLAVSSTITLYRQRFQPAFGNDKLIEILLSTPSNDSAAEWLRYYTSGPHLAGKNYSQAAWTRDRWAEWGAAAHIDAYDIYLNTPVDHSVALLKPAKGDDKGDAEDSASQITWEIDFKASLEEDIIPEDPTTALLDRVPTFHGYSASGNVTGPIVYVNYGTFEDYADLERANISLKGAIVLVRYGGIFRGLKVKRAQELGAVGALLYSDPGDDGGVTIANGYKPYPEGPARQPSAVQRGSVQYISVLPGDPTTPGYPSKPGVPRGPSDSYLPQIPSIPISYSDALPILEALNGYGPTSKDFGHWWTRNEGLGSQGIKYNIGPTPADKVQVNLYNEQYYNITPIWNVIGIFNGSVLPNEVVVIGNHRDAWIAGGSVDPNSGSAVVNEVVRSFGAAAALGWRPIRTIVFASWDGEEYGLLGSTEWVEEYLPWLQHTSLVYVNIDTGVSGPHFRSAAVPLVSDIVRKATSLVPSPNQTVPGQTVRDTWSGDIGVLGSGSDFTAFLDHAGITSVDVRFSGAGDAASSGDAAASAARKPEAGVDPVYHYHSNYDSYHWMEKYGDPGFAYHKAMAQVLGVLVAHLANDLVVPFKAVDYANAIQTYVDKVHKQFEKHGATDAAETAASSNEIMAMVRGRRLNHEQDASAAGGDDDNVHKELFRKALDRLDSTVADLVAHATVLDAKADSLRERTGKGDDNDGDDEDGFDENAGFSAIFALAPSWWKRLVRRVGRLWLALQVVSVNRKYQFLDRHFLFEGGLDDRSWFKHVIYAPGLWTGYSGALFPGLVESIDAGDWKNGLKWAGIIEGTILAAGNTL